MTTLAIKVIWRLDFPVSYPMLDARGSVLRAIHETVPGFYDDVSDGSVPQSFLAKSMRDDAIGVMSVEPTSLNGSIEWPEGADVARLLETEEFRSVDKTVKALTRILQLQGIARGGLRSFLVSRSDDGFDKRNYEKFIAQPILDFANEELGTLSDVGVVLEGSHSDGLFYRAHFGPVVAKNIGMTLSKANADRDARLERKFDIFYDIDVYERDFTLLSGSLYRWSTTKLARAATLAKMWNRHNFGILG